MIKTSEWINVEMKRQKMKAFLYFAAYDKFDIIAGVSFLSQRLIAKQTSIN